jgi:predicted component of type VI protein secretion system
MRKKNIYIISMVSLLILSGCATTSRKAFVTRESQVKLRSMQTRAFDTNDKENMMQAVISTLQDLEFVIDKADYLIGSVTGSKFLGNAVVKTTVTVRPRGEKQLLVRMNSQYGTKNVEDPEPYQDFFTALEKSLFLTAHKVD